MDNGNTLLNQSNYVGDIEAIGREKAVISKNKEKLNVAYNCGKKLVIDFE